jgi:hypothetical protein
MKSADQFQYVSGDNNTKTDVCRTLTFEKYIVVGFG